MPSGGRNGPPPWVFERKWVSAMGLPKEMGLRKEMGRRNGSPQWVSAMRFIVGREPGRVKINEPQFDPDNESTPSNSIPYMIVRDLSTNKPNQLDLLVQSSRYAIRRTVVLRMAITLCYCCTHTTKSLLFSTF